MSNEESMIELGKYYEEGIRPSEEAIKHIIHVLQNTDDDCISRHEVLNIVNFEDKWLLDAKGHNADTEIAFSGLKSKISDLPSVNPQKPKSDVLDKIRAEIIEEKGCAYADFERYKVDYLGQDWEDALDSLPQDDFRYGMERAVEIIDRYKAESEG